MNKADAFVQDLRRLISDSGFVTIILAVVAAATVLAFGFGAPRGVDVNPRHHLSVCRRQAAQKELSARRFTRSPRGFMQPAATAGRADRTTPASGSLRCDRLWRGIPR